MITTCIFCKEILFFKFMPICNRCNQIACWTFNNIFFLGNLKFISLLKYDNLTYKPIMELKYNSNPFIAKQIGWIIAYSCKEFLKDIQIITSVPMYWKKYFIKNYNHSSEIAKWVAYYSNKTYFECLIKENFTTQKNKKREERIININNSLKININCIEYIKNKRVLIIDDMITTGATIYNCAQILLPYCLEIKGLSFARSISFK